MIKEIWKKCNILTFVGIMFAVLGISFCFKGKTDFAIIALILAGICDAIDGPVARRINKEESKYGIQLDSLADIVASGVLPISICMSMGYTNYIDMVIYAIFIICGITRLSYYNVNSKDEDCFTGIPITSSTMVLPLLYIIIKNEIAFVAVIALLSIGFVLNIKIKKPSLIIKIILSIIGIIVSIYIILFKYLHIAF